MESLDLVDALERSVTKLTHFYKDLVKVLERTLTNICSDTSIVYLQECTDLVKIHSCVRERTDTHFY